MENKMSPVKQRIAIAKACRVTVPMVDVTNYFVSSEPCLQPDIGALPDYLNDLNAMHGAEKVLTSESLWPKYLGYLSEGVGCGYLTHATAAQRAEAFLKTLKLWCD